MIFEAIEFAARAHKGQYRKASKIPYIIHPLTAAGYLIQNNYSEEIAIAAILHDTVEDTPVTIDEIRGKFGNRVADIVLAASEPQKSLEWKKRKQHTIDIITNDADPETLAVICADKLNNIRSLREDYLTLGNNLWSRFKGSKEQQKWYYTTLANIFIRRTRDFNNNKLFKLFKKEVDNFFKMVEEDKNT